MKEILTILKQGESNRKDGVNVTLAHSVILDDDGNGVATYQIHYGKDSARHFDKFDDANRIFKESIKPKFEYGLVSKPDEGTRIIGFRISEEYFEFLCSLNTFSDIEGQLEYLMNERKKNEST